MIELRNEQLLTLADATKLIPGRFGKKLSIKTIHRWALHGVRGVQLETVKMGGRKMTSREAIQRFGYALTLSRQCQPQKEGRVDLKQTRPAVARDQKAVDEALTQARIIKEIK